ncbi:gluconate 2-dehydrogenase subunit 3 family protein [Flavobacterium gilvum]|uniref:Twin-arginine translocation pathway signal protein n=1 Tax=Flavobacterium gilvum TaxID=1492737 RepID=A0AAC9I5G3_9FLAO|nr:gluconate 2-dehydrogenase subunit 3 family protein [Flavobacterium gilvum]AOW09952.1 twin-arginine translocation pathway signal protein [Flavobacterium gilvum]KFC59007.1 twin-arginine translocation pathway signal protein [Flavobacterium gilvum]
MERREALKKIAFLMGGAISATTMGVLFESFTVYDPEQSTYFYSLNDEEVLGEFSEIILPTTAKSPGAKAAGVGALIPQIIQDCYPPKLQEVFKNGFQEMLTKCKSKFNKEFMSLSNEDKNLLMNELRQEALNNQKKPSFFIIARDLTLLGYFSSEIGCTIAREYLPIPGRYDGNADYKEGQKAWAT